MQGHVDDEMDQIHAIGNGAKLEQERHSQKTSQPTGTTLHRQQEHGRIKGGHPGEADGLHAAGHGAVRKEEQRYDAGCQEAEDNPQCYKILP